MLKTIFGKIWLIWGLLVFVISWPFVMIAYLFTYRILPKKNKYRSGFAVSKVWGKFVNFFLGVRIQQYGKNEIDFTKQYVYVCNHRSQIDIPINFTTIPNGFVILSKKSAARIPVVGTNLKHAHVTVDRRKPEDRKDAMIKLSSFINRGHSVLIYPEGRRLRSNDKLGRLHDGAFSLATKHKLPIIPITIVGSDKINNPKKPFQIFPGKVKVYFDLPIESANRTEELKSEIRSIMESHLM